tara:strand:- start:211 stop:702 length:492 start_codon:yes stop_codon:yes gene_type:complete
MNKNNYKNIKLIVSDFDGVMTDDKLYLDENGNESVKLNRSDGLAISYFLKKKIKVIVISSEKNKVVRKRCEKLRIDCFHGMKSKLDTLLEYCSKNNINNDELIYIGNDINDLEIVNNTKFSMCPIDANYIIKEKSSLILKTEGGNGVIREVLDLFIQNRIIQI